MYDSMLLSTGGGVIGTRQKSGQYNDEASLIIGIGGTGVAALTRLKQKVYQQLQPDDPDSAVPEYKHIRFLAIDSDETVSMGSGQGKLTRQEFFSIHNSALAAVYGTEDGRRLVKDEPTMNWLDIDHIVALLNPHGAGGVRQIGRYLLVSKASLLKAKIADECTAALKATGKPNLNIYICAGISGGTGSGCFLDTCYIVNKVIEEKGWVGNAKVMGFFFLPDVVISKLSNENQGAISYNQSNGYAAMKELDYLMDLKNAHDRFKQKYGQFEIDTDKPPVDLCHLISATKADGTVMENGFSYCINVVADYIINYLADIEGVALAIDPSNDGGLTIRGHLANVGRGVDSLQVSYGANRAYHVIGASNGEIPMTQIATYLAIGFYERFENRVGRGVAEEKIHKQAVDQWVRKEELDSDAILGKVKSGCGPLKLPTIDRKILHDYGAMPLGQLPGPWATYGNNYLDQCAGKRKTNATALAHELESFDRKHLIETNAASLIAKVFGKLYDLCIDPEYGPYYAAALIHNGGYDLRAAVRGAITTLQQQYQTQQMQLHGHEGMNNGLAYRIVQVSTDFYNHNNKKNYTAYEDVVTAYYNTMRQSQDLLDTEAVFQKFLASLERLYDSFFAPLCSMLDNLRDTFRQNKEYLATPAARETSAYTWRILELSDVRESLDAAIGRLQDQGNVTDFMDYVLKGCEEWRSLDEGKICLFISRYLEDVFQNEMNKSLQDYLYQKFPQAQNAQQLSQEIERQIIQPVYDQASAMFWCRPDYLLASNTFVSASITVPRQSDAVCSAAENYVESTQNVTIRKTSLKDRIFALRFFSGVPFFAYQGVTLLKGQYDAAEGTAAGPGAHLYERTGRGEGGEKDWRHYLPTPSPYSMNPGLVDNAEELSRLYDKGCELGIIAQIMDTTGVPTRDFVVYRTIEVPDRTFEISDYMRDYQGRKMLNEVKLEQDRDALIMRRENPFAVQYLSGRLSLLNNGAIERGEDVVKRVRKDYFLHYPVLQEVVRNEIAKLDKLNKQIQALDEIRQSHESYAQEMEQFANLLFYGILASTNSYGNEDYTNINKIQYEYKDGSGTPRVYVFSEPNMEHGREYPLYQAFIRYREINPEVMPRREIDKKLSVRRGENLRPGDNRIGRELEKAWNGDRLIELENALATDSDGETIIQFYRSIVAEIAKFRNRFPTYEDWISEGTGQAQTPPQAQPAVSRTWSVWTGTEYVTIYDNYAPGLGLTSANQWVQLQNGWLISWNGQWIPLQLDASGIPVNLPR